MPPTTEDALAHLAGLWPKWKATEHEKKLCRDKLGCLRPAMLIEAMDTCRIRYSSESPLLARIIDEYNILFEKRREMESGPREGTGPAGYWVFYWEHRDGYSQQLSNSARFWSADEAFRFAKGLPTQESILRRPRVTDLMGNPYTVGEHGLLDQRNDDPVKNHAFPVGAGA
jgi:hypothetical protein